MAWSPLQDPAAGCEGGGPGELSEVLNSPVCHLNGAAEWRTSVPQTLDCRAEAGQKQPCELAKAQERAISREGGRVYRAPGSPKFFVSKRGGRDSHRLAGKSQGE